MSDLEPLLDEIAELLDQRRGADDPARLEQTLTDGYARALTLEAERTTPASSGCAGSRATLGESGGSSTSEVSALARRLDACDVSFERLRERARAPAGAATRARCAPASG